MRTLRLKRTVSFVAVCAIVISAIISISSGVRAGTQDTMPVYSFRTPPLPPITRAYRLPAGITHPTPIAAIKRLPDGARIYIHRKTITAISNGYVYIQEPDLSAGIRVDLGMHYIPSDVQTGDLITFSGVMGTQDAERVVLPDEDPTYDTTPVSTIPPLGMATSTLMGWPIDRDNPTGPRVAGLMPIGLFVEVWGKVTAMDLVDDDGMWYVYLDDGWGHKDGGPDMVSGIRVYCDRIPGWGENYLGAVGVCATKTVDPTPSGPDGDEFVIPVVRCTGFDDLYTIGPQQQERSFGSVSGRIRLEGQSAPGVDVRIYARNSSVIVPNVTDEGADFSLRLVSNDGEKITASATGYVSTTLEVTGGQDNVDITLGKSEKYAEIFSDRTSLRSCSDELAQITLMLRDSEGKGLQGQIKLTTNLGSFTATGTNEAIVTTDDEGFASTTLTAAPDSSGTATVVAEPYGEQGHSEHVNITYYGPILEIWPDDDYLSGAGTSTIKAKLMDGVTPLPSAPITFRTDFGVFQQSGTNTCASYTNENGEASAVLVLSTPGTARIVADYTNNCGHQATSWTSVSCGSQPWYPQGVQYSNPMVVDLDGDPDGKKEVVVVTSSGILVALRSNAEVMWFKTVHPPGSNTPSCVVLDNERSGRPCVFLPAENQTKTYAYSYDGRPLAGWPTGSNYRFIKVAASIADMNLDGVPEVVAGDECCYVFSWNPTGDWLGTGSAESSFLWRNLTGTPSTAIYGSTCALGDLDGDANAIPDLVVGTNRAPEVYAFPGDCWGDFITNPLYLDGWPRYSNSRVETSPAIGDLDGDGRNDVVMGADDGNVYIWLSSDGSWNHYQLGAQMKSSPALADLDDDGKLDVVIGTDTGKLHAINWKGEDLPGWNGGIALNPHNPMPIESSPVVGDVTGDGEIDVVVGCNDGNIYAVYKDGLNHSENGVMLGPIAWVRSCRPSGQSSAQVLTAPVIDDLDNDGLVDVLAASDKGIFIFKFNVPYTGDPALYPWPTFHRDNQRTGCASAPAEPIRAAIQGIITKDGAPVSRARVYIYNEDDSTVPVPYSNPPVARDYVMSVGGPDANEAGKGAYCINQLEPDRTYKLRIVAAGSPDKWVTVPVTKGAVRVDIEL